MRWPAVIPTRGHVSSCPLCGGGAERRRWGHSFSITIVCRGGCGKYRTTLRVLTELMARDQGLRDDLRDVIRDLAARGKLAAMRFGLDGRIVVMSSDPT